MGEAQTIILENTSEVAERSLTIVEQAKDFVVIRDVAHYTKGGELWKQVCAMMAEVDEGFDKNIKRWHEGHKGALADKARYWNPLNEVKKTIKIGMEKFDRAQEAIRLAEQRRLEEIARKEAEERALLEAIAAEEDAKRNGATKEEAAQEAAAIIEDPVYVAPVILQKTTPKLAGGPVYRTIWKFKIENEALIPRQYMVPNETAIGQVVRALKGQTNIPGVKIYEERC